MPDIIPKKELMVFHHLTFRNRNLLVLYLYKDYIFGITKEIDPNLKIPQISADELERIIKLSSGSDEATARIEQLLSARAIFKPDMSIEVPMFNELKDAAGECKVVTYEDMKKFVLDLISLEEHTQKNIYKQKNGKWAVSQPGDKGYIPMEDEKVEVKKEEEPEEKPKVPEISKSKAPGGGQLDFLVGLGDELGTSD